MRFMGSKGRIAKKLAAVILADTSARGTYHEPFIGGGSMAAQMGQNFNVAYYSDISPDLAMMWDALLHGWQPPTVVTVEEYQALKHAAPSPLRGFVGSGGSFGGKWFGGYARGGFNSNGQPRNHQAESARAVLKDASTMRAKHVTEAFWADALLIRPEPGDVVYCDPPYAGTTTYNGTDAMDHSKFWETVTGWAKIGVHVYVSEYAAPDDWVSIWEQPLRSSVRIGSEERHMAIERLFKWKAQA